jgi:hypothetical protein
MLHIARGVTVARPGLRRVIVSRPGPNSVVHSSGVEGLDVDDGPARKPSTSEARSGHARLGCRPHLRGRAGTISTRGLRCHN